MDYEKLGLFYLGRPYDLASNAPREGLLLYDSKDLVTHAVCVGMTGIEPVDFNGQSIVPIQFLKALLPDPASLGPRTKGKTCIGCLVEGTKDGKPRKSFIYNVSDHAECYKEVRSQAISYTTGVPAMIGAMMMLTGAWSGAGVFNMEQLDPTPFLEALGKHGLPWKVLDY